jgi:S-adenosylmethionine decarboxylase
LAPRQKKANSQLKKENPVIKPSPFGYLLTLDLYNCKEGVCDDIDLCYRFLNDIVLELKMEKQAPPFVFKSDAVKYPDKAGLSGWVPLIESGVQIHTLAAKNFITVDVYSCRHFKTDTMQEFVHNWFSPKEFDMNFIERGLKFNHC